MLCPCLALWVLTNRNHWPHFAEGEIRGTGGLSDLLLDTCTVPALGPLGLSVPGQDPGAEPAPEQGGNIRESSTSSQDTGLNSELWRRKFRFPKELLYWGQLDFPFALPGPKSKEGTEETLSGSRHQHFTEVLQEHSASLQSPKHKHPLRHPPADLL